MIKQDEPYTFAFNNAQRDFKPRAEEIFLLQCEVDETEWHYLGCFPTDAIGAVTLAFDDLPDRVTLGFEAFRRTHRTPASGEMFFIEMTLISESDWLRFLPQYRFRLGEATIAWTTRREKAKPKAKAKAPTPYGAFWHELDRIGFHNRPDVRQWIDYHGADGDEAKDFLRYALGVLHRSVEASPEMLIAAMRKAGSLDGAITAVETAKGKING